MSALPTRVHVLGCGALGSLVAARLQAAGVPTAVVLRKGSPRWRCVRGDGTVGIAVAEADGGTTRVAVAAVDGVDAAAPSPRVVVCTKAYDAAAARRAAGGRRDAAAPPVQRRAVLGGVDARAAAGATTHGCYERAPFDVSHAGPARYHHLFPVAAFPGRVAEDGACFACGGGLAPRAFDARPAAPRSAATATAPSTLALRAPAGLRLKNGAALAQLGIVVPWRRSRPRRGDAGAKSAARARSPRRARAARARAASAGGEDREVVPPERGLEPEEAPVHVRRAERGGDVRDEALRGQAPRGARAAARRARARAASTPPSRAAARATAAAHAARDAAKPRFAARRSVVAAIAARSRADAQAPRGPGARDAARRFAASASARRRASPKGTATWPRGPRVTCAWDAATHALRVSWPQAVGPAPLPLAADLYEINIAASPLATASGVHVTGGLSAELGLDVLLPETTTFLRISEWTTTVDYLLNHNAADAGGLALLEDKSAADCEEATPTDRRWGRLPAAPPRRDATASSCADGAAGATHAGVVDVFARDEAAPVGRWYSHPAAGACEPARAPGDAGCAWRHGATARVVRGAQLYQLGLNASGLTCDLGDFLAPDGDTGRLRQVSPDRDPWVADCAPLAAQVRQNAAVLRAAVAAAPLAPWTRVVPEVPDDAEVFEDVLSMRKLMQAMSQAAKRKASHDVRARNRAAREQVRHEEVMRQVQKAFADQDEYVRARGGAQRTRSSAWRRRQREEQRERQLRRARGGSLPDIHAGPAPAPEEAAAPRSPPPAAAAPPPRAGAFAEGFAPPGAAKGRRRFDVGPRAPAPPGPHGDDAETTELMARINGAYETLCDPETRATYDATALAT
ncbi:hypothetical protein SO694_00019323 [Aureococcus anophagefferens]|uniref:Ketopantoate reductase N-terminal domain-containing protein n=1 Tax=Aureococcus anophagefferens TaxID=44056 RepID=A0ABR1G038_AURAN